MISLSLEREEYDPLEVAAGRGQDRRADVSWSRPLTLLLPCVGGGGEGGTYAPAFLQRSDTIEYFLCTGAFLYARFSFLLISNKFCDLNQCGSMRIRIRIRVRLKSHKKFNFYISTFLGPKWHSPVCSIPFHRAQKSLDFQGPTPTQMVCEKRPQVRIRCLRTTVLKVGNISCR